MADQPFGFGSKEVEFESGLSRRKADNFFIALGLVVVAVRLLEKYPSKVLVWTLGYWRKPKAGKSPGKSLTKFFPCNLFKLGPRSEFKFRFFILLKNKLWLFRDLFLYKLG